ncbi:SANT/Myb_domain [Hexamita inflata]|uniref:SANT/Myb_domain n=1 Tax=Hexamita inflata TaxID=28002 RepID=A0ABP1GZD8_9EUKA
MGRVRAELRGESELRPCLLDAIVLHHNRTNFCIDCSFSVQLRNQAEKQLWGVALKQPVGNELHASSCVKILDSHYKAKFRKRQTLSRPQEAETIPALSFKYTNKFLCGCASIIQDKQSYFPVSYLYYFMNIQSIFIWLTESSVHHLLVLFVYQIHFHFWIMKKTQLWTEADSKLFLELSKKYHNDFHQIAEEMHRTYSQVRSHHYNLQRKPSKSESEKPKPKDKKKVSKKNSRQGKQHYSYIIFDDID